MPILCKYHFWWSWWGLSVHIQCVSAHGPSIFGLWIVGTVACHSIHLSQHPAITYPRKYSGGGGGGACSIQMASVLPWRAGCGWVTHTTCHNIVSSNNCSWFNFIFGNNVKAYALEIWGWWWYGKTWKVSMHKGKGYLFDVQKLYADTLYKYATLYSD